MRFVVFDNWQVGILREDGIHSVSSVVPEPWRGSPRAMNWVVEHYDECRGEIEAAAGRSPAWALEAVRLRPPVPIPMELLAAPANNASHVAEMRKVDTASSGSGHGPREVGFFLKAPASIIGPSDAIELPNLPGRRFDHESELAFVVGKEARGVKREQARNYIFGYTCLIDVTLRNGQGRAEERPMRKSFATFSPVGPTLVTADEIEDPNRLAVRLWVNGEIRQDSNTRELVVGVEELLEIASAVLPLQPGDLFTTGSPAGVGQIVPGDILEVELEKVGRMRLPVVAREW